MTDVDIAGGAELGNAESAFRARPTGQSARLYLLAWADSRTGSSASVASPDLLRKFAQDDVYCEAYADAETARAREDWPGVATAVAKFQAAGDRIANAN
ncbi:MAG: hypothetical protein JOY64_28120 [Alphaproteobacteria bacterium]|nr:hypothetical protein [Alphaproteobacteria bacterium]MBV8411526.1 hypothetical protein [Alphaproteobacteria bacterium]